MRKHQRIPTYNPYHLKVKFSEITKLAVYLHITYLYLQAPQFSEMKSPTEKSFCVIEYEKTNSCTSVQRSCDFFLWGYVKNNCLCYLFHWILIN
jgi:hypothetical protein